MAHAQKPDFVLRAKRTSPFKSAGGRQFSRLLAARGVRFSGSNAGYTMFRGSAKSTGYPLHSPISPSLYIPCVTVCHHISTGLYYCISILDNKVSVDTRDLSSKFRASGVSLLIVANYKQVFATSIQVFLGFPVSISKR